MSRKGREYHWWLTMLGSRDGERKERKEGRQRWMR
jgi:hypothetical protein